MPKQAEKHRPRRRRLSWEVPCCVRHTHLSEHGGANAYMLDPEGARRLQGSRKVAAHGKSAYSGLLNCFLRGLVLSINTGSVVFFNPSAELHCIQPKMLVDQGLSMPHQNYLQPSPPVTYNNPAHRQCSVSLPPARRNHPLRLLNAPVQTSPFHHRNIRSARNVFHLLAFPRSSIWKYTAF